MRSVRTKSVSYIIALPFAALLLAGCTGSGGSGGSDHAAQQADEAAPQQQRAGAGAGADAGEGRQRNSGAQQADLRQPPDEQHIIYTASLSVRADDVADAADRARALVTDAGGHVAEESSSSRPQRAELTFKVPAARYAEVLGELDERIGERIKLTQEAEDVTEKVADVDSRVASAEAALKSLRKLYDRADTIDEILRVERELGEREAELESLQARQKSLQEQTRFATVQLTLRAPDEKADPDDDESQGGFIGGVKSGWGAFVAFFAGLSLVVGWMLPFLALLALLAVPAWRLRRRYLPLFQRRAAASASAPRAEPPLPE